MIGWHHKTSSCDGVCTVVETISWNPAVLLIFVAFNNNFPIFWYSVLLQTKEASLASIYFELQQNDIWTESIQSFELSFKLPFELQLELKLVQWKMLLGRIWVSKSSYAFIIFLFLFVGSSPTQGDFFSWNLILNGLFCTYSNTLEIHVINLWEICTRNEQNRDRDLFMFVRYIYSRIRIYKLAPPITR